MRYKRFEDLPVWNTAIELVVAVFALTSKPPFKSQHALRDQLERAAVSVSNNIAEGFERGTNKESCSCFSILRAGQLVKSDQCVVYLTGCRISLS